MFSFIRSYKEPGMYMLDDGCGNTLDIVAESNLGKKIL